MAGTVSHAEASRNQAPPKACVLNLPVAGLVAVAVACGDREDTDNGSPPAFGAGTIAAVELQGAALLETVPDVLSRSSPALHRSSTESARSPPPSTPLLGPAADTAAGHARARPLSGLVSSLVDGLRRATALLAVRVGDSTAKAVTRRCGHRDGQRRRRPSMCSPAWLSAALLCSRSWWGRPRPPPPSTGARPRAAQVRPGHSQRQPRPAHPGQRPPSRSGSARPSRFWPGRPWSPPSPWEPAAPPPTPTARSGVRRRREPSAPEGPQRWDRAGARPRRGGRRGADPDRHPAAAGDPAGSGAGQDRWRPVASAHGRGLLLAAYGIRRRVPAAKQVPQRPSGW